MAAAVGAAAISALARSARVSRARRGDRDGVKGVLAKYAKDELRASYGFEAALNARAVPGVATVQERERRALNREARSGKSACGAGFDVALTVLLRA